MYTRMYPTAVSSHAATVHARNNMHARLPASNARRLRDNFNTPEGELHANSRKTVRER